VALREFFILVGIVAASVLPTTLADNLGDGLHALVGVVWPLLGLGALSALVWAPLPVLHRAPVRLPVSGQLKAAIGEPRFRGLLSLFALSAVATAVAATLGAFYIADVLEAESRQEQFFGAYFVCAVASLPVWTVVARRIGFARSWFLGLVLTVAAFLIAPFLGAGDVGGYLVLCVIAGLALGAELVVPAAWLAALLAADPPGSERAGACLGWWTLMNKLEPGHRRRLRPAADRDARLPRRTAGSGRTGGTHCGLRLHADRAQGCHRAAAAAAGTAHRRAGPGVRGRSAIVASPARCPRPRGQDLRTPTQHVIQPHTPSRSPVVATDNPVPTPPFWGTRCIEQMPLRALLPYINRTTLYKFQWGFKPQGRRGRGVPRVRARTLRADPQASGGGVGRPRHPRAEGAVRLFSCSADGDQLVVYGAPDSREELCRFPFPRQTTERRLCISDFFRSVDSGERDVVAFQLVTVGQRASDFARELFQKDSYREYLYWHGLNAEGAEALAEWVHKRIRVELGFSREESRDLEALIKQDYRGSRYSFGYPACPNLADQDKILTLLGADRIGVVLGDEDQLWPEDEHHRHRRPSSAGQVLRRLAAGLTGATLAAGRRGGSGLRPCPV
jgi:5-methyltetrahydrofolate--homocysteine methyltransferase